MANVSVYNIEGKEVGTIDLNDAVFGVEVNEHLLHMAVVNQLANKRQGTQKAKTRSEVSGGGRKPWRQKGTGHARQGSTRSPQWTGGGVVFAPTPRDYSFKLNKKEKRAALKSALTTRVLENKFIVLDEMNFGEIKTKKFQNCKIRTQFAIVILLAGALCYLLFSFLWGKRYETFGYLNDKFNFYPQLNDDSFWGTLYEEALKYDIPDSEDDKETIEKMQPFFDLVDDYTGIYLYGLEDGIFLCGKTPISMEKHAFRSFFDFGYALTGGEGETPISFPIQFKNGMAQVHITFYHSSFFLYPYCMVLLVVCIGFFLFLVLFFVSRKMKQIIRLKDDVLVMAGGDLSHPFPDYQKNEIGILSHELDHLRIAFDENIQSEQESRKANQDLITAMSHDLRTPLTILNGYLEILKQQKRPDKQEEYLNRCLQKTADIKEMTDRMFEYALVFDPTETPELHSQNYALLRQILMEHCEFLKLVGFQTELAFPESTFFFLCDVTMLKRIFSNLFSNIIKYGDKQDRITVTVTQALHSITIKLTNTVKKDFSAIESNQIGLKSTVKMMQLMGGTTTIEKTATQFSVLLTLKNERS